MLYPRKNDAELSRELFENPTCEYRGTPFWAWNCKLEREELLRQIDVLKEMGMGGFHMHVRSGMNTVYLGEEFMELVSACVEKAKKNGMLAWLYDEDRWPSGFAGGLVTKDEEYRIRYLLMTVKPYSETKETSKLHCNEQNVASRGGENAVLIARFDIVLDENGFLKSYKTLADGEAAKGTVWYAYIESPRNNPRYNGTTYVNTLDKRSIERFVEVTHEAYKKKLGADFGKTVPAIFTDEPQTTFKTALRSASDTSDVTLPWTDDIEETFTAEYGFSLIETIPELIWQLPENAVSRGRYCYHDHIAERFAVAFCDTIGDWCKSNGIYLTGHMMHEPTLRSQTLVSGDVMRMYRSFGLPGIDILVARHELTTAKQAQSAANQYGAEGVLSELYGVTTWDFDFRGHKLSGDWQAALGVTVRVHHLSWVSMEGEAKRDYPASINYQSPWYSEYSYIEDHFARVNTALTRGKPVVRIGVIHPIESYWLHWGPVEQTTLISEDLDGNFVKLTEWLLYGNLDFDFICEATLPDLCENGTAPFTVGEMKYDAIVVPGCETLRKTTLERLEQFRNSGGKLIFMGEAPKYTDAAVSELPSQLYNRSISIPYCRSALLNALESVRNVEIRNDKGALSNNMIYRMREDNGKYWLFIANGKDPYNKDVSITAKLFTKVKGMFTVTLYDTLNGTVRPVPYTHTKTHTVIPADVYQADSLLYLLTPSQEEYKETVCVSEKLNETKYQAPDNCEYVLDEPNALLLDLAEWAVDDEDYNSRDEILKIDTAVRKRFGWTPWGGEADQPWYMPGEAPSHVLKLRYTFNSETDIDDAFLAIENPETADVFFNSDKVPSVPVSWYVDKSIKTVKLGNIRKGLNTLVVELPYGEKTAAERIYVLGYFGVRTEGTQSTIVPLPKKLCFGNIAEHGFPFYSGKLTYKFSVNTERGKLSIKTPQFRASTLRIHCNGNSLPVALSPYTAEFQVEAGEQKIAIDAYIPRTNGFGPLHCADVKLIPFQGPDSWRTVGDKWCYEYRPLPEGILSAPEIRLFN